MRALTWQGKRDVRVETVPDPTIQQPTDAIVRITSTAICGSDLHLYEVLGAVPHPRRHPRPRADGHRRGGRPRGDPHQGRATGSSSRSTSPAARAGCARAGCTPSARPRRCREQGKGAALFGYTSLYGAGAGRPGRVPAGAAGPLRPDQGAGGHAGRAVPLPLRRPADRLAGRRATPTCPAGGTLAVLGLGPIGPVRRPDRPAPRRRARHRRSTSVPERLPMAARHGVEVLDLREVDDVAAGPDRAAPAAAARTP